MRQRVGDRVQRTLNDVEYLGLSEPGFIADFDNELSLGDGCHG